MWTTRQFTKQTNLKTMEMVEIFIAEIDVFMSYFEGNGSFL